MREKIGDMPYTDRKCCNFRLMTEKRLQLGNEVKNENVVYKKTLCDIHFKCSFNQPLMEEDEI